jgi:CubicO group peptidase (beta-lactamase class C family)
MLRVISLAALALLLVAMPACVGSTQPPPTDYSAVIAAMPAVVKKAMDENQVTGLAVALVDGQRVVWAQGFGYADLEAKVPAAPDTVFEIGSNSKTITALAVMRLVEQGKIDLDKPIQTYLPQFSIKQRFPESGPITVRSLLTHHNGIPGDIFINSFVTKPDPNWINWLIDDLKGESTAAPVGYAMAYSNSAFNLLEPVIVNASGQSFEAYTAQLFADLNMKDTSFLARTFPAGRVAKGYAAGTVQPYLYANLLTAGSVRSTALDMAEYLKVLLSGGGKVVKPETLAELFKPQVDAQADFSNPMGLSWFLVDPEIAYAGRQANHDGATVEMTSRTQLLPDQGLGVVVLTNSITGIPAIQAIAREALKSALQAKKGLAAPPKAPLPASPDVTLAPDKLKALEGLYVGESDPVLIKLSGGSLIINGDEGKKLVPLQNGQFRVSGQPYRLEFRELGKNMVLGLWVDGPSGQRVGQRINPTPISAAWKARYGNYEIINVSPYDSSRVVDPRIALTKPTLTVKEKDGLLLLGETLRGDVIIDPVADNLAFTAGLGRNRGESVQVLTVGGQEIIQLWGGQYRKVK